MISTSIDTWKLYEQHGVDEAADYYIELAKNDNVPLDATMIYEKYIMGNIGVIFMPSNVEKIRKRLEQKLQTSAV